MRTHSCLVWAKVARQNLTVEMEFGDVVCQSHCYPGVCRRDRVGCWRRIHMSWRQTYTAARTTRLTQSGGCNCFERRSTSMRPSLSQASFTYAECQDGCFGMTNRAKAIAGSVLQFRPVECAPWNFPGKRSLFSPPTALSDPSSKCREIHSKRPARRLKSFRFRPEKSKAGTKKIGVAP